MERAKRLERLSAAAAGLTRAVLESTAVTSPEVRLQAFHGSIRDGAVGEYVDVLARDAHLVTDSHLTRLRNEGFSEDGIFELTVTAAVGAAQRRLDAALAMLHSPGDS